MGIFAPLYERAMRWSAHRHAPRYLGALSFSEAIFFPIMPEVMLAPMTLAQPRHWFWFASISLFWSTLGALVGYALGHWAIELITPWLIELGYGEKFEQVKQVARDDGFWFLLIGGFTPIPFKLLTLASGAVSMPLLPFVAGALIGRGKRVYLVTGVIRLGGPRAEAWLRRNIEYIGYAVLLLLMLVLAAFKFWPRG
jgi:membrane protein YqaA with SNARE-associated domain